MANAIPLIDLVRCPARTEEQIESQLGPLQQLQSAPEPYVESVFEPISPPKGARCVGRTACFEGEYGFFRERDHWIRINMVKLLQPNLDCRVLVDPGFDGLRLVGYYLEPLVRIRAAVRGDILVHSSSVAMGSNAILLTAWGNTGKTNLMLQLGLDGAERLSDDWTLITRDGRLHGYPRAINILNYNFAAFPELKTLLSWPRRVGLEVDAAARIIRRRLRFADGGLTRGFDVLERLLERLVNTRVPLESGSSPASGYRVARAFDLRKVASRSRSSPCDSTSFVRRQAECFLYENRRFLDRLAEARFAHPDACIPDDAAVSALYRAGLTAVVDTWDRGTLMQLDVPARADRPTLRALSQRIRSSAQTVAPQR